MKENELLSFTTNTIYMLENNLSVYESIKSYIPMSRLHKGLFSKLAEDVNKGRSLSQAMEAFPRFFSKFYISLIKVGEKTEDIVSILKLAKIIVERDINNKKAIKNYISYPVLLLSVFVWIFIFVVAAVLPTIKEVYESFGSSIFFGTKLLLMMSDAIQQYYFLFIIVMLSMFIYLWVRVKKTGLFELLSFIPAIKKLYSQENEMMLGFVLGGLLKNGYPVVESLELAKNVIRNNKFQTGIQELVNSVKKGESFSKSVSKSKLFSADFKWIVAIGEEKEDLPGSLLWFSEYFNMLINEEIKYFVVFLERMSVVFLAVVIGFLVISIYFPLFELGSLVDSI